MRPLLGEAGKMGSDIGEEEEKLQKGHQAENGITRRGESDSRGRKLCTRKIQER